jgi:ATP-binding cassette, subfamily B, bacterial PglK
VIRILRDLYMLVRPSGRLRLAGVLALLWLQALTQSVAVFSVVPFLTAVTDMPHFRGSRAGRAVAQVIGGGTDERLLLWSGVASLLFLVCGNLVSLTAEYGRLRYAQTIAHRVRQELVKQLLDRRYEYFLGVNTSMLVKHVIEDVGVTAQVVLALALDLISRGLLAVLLVAGLGFLEPGITMLGCLVIVAYYWIVVRPIRSSAARVSHRVKRDLRALHFEVQHLLGGIKPILATGQAPSFARRTEQVSGRLTDEIAVLPWLPALLRSSMELLVFGGMIAWVVGAVMAHTGLAAIIPRVGLLGMIAYRLMPSIQTIFADIASMVANRHSLEEVIDFVREQPLFAEARPAPSSASSAGPLNWSREVRFQNVSFTYGGAAAPAVEHVSLVIAKGKRTAIVGTTGAGKSTLIDLVLGLHRPTQGQILVDDRPITAERMAAWRRTVGYVPQELFLLDGTIEDNITFSRTVQLERVAEAVRLAHANDFIDLDSGGLATPVGERGMRLSGGQRQRLAFARALYGQPSLLLLDEGTSALDFRTEEEVLASLGTGTEDLTVVTVTHRIDSIKDYDCIHFLERGRLVCSGNFIGLLEREDAFRRFVGQSEHSSGEPSKQRCGSSLEAELCRSS